MKELQTTSSGVERAVLVGVYQGSKDRGLEIESLQELAELVRSAGAEVVDQFIQDKERLSPAYLLGKGKLEEVRNFVLAYQADFVVFDLDLTPAQSRNLESFLEAKVLDRSELILDIFAQRARSREGKLQVELAQLEYLLPRLSGKGLALSRLAGGIGTRGPGETKLETDRRLIRRRISKIRRELQKLEKRRELHRNKRKGIPILTVSLVGYTNAGKSTLFNRITQESSYADNRMFATLDPLVRRVVLPSGQEILVADTVGFIRKLPHSLVAAFHATLEETGEADLILHVIDVSQPNFPALRQVVYEVLEDIGFGDRSVLEAYNKTDLLGKLPRIDSGQRFCHVSARTGEGLPRLLGELESLLNQSYQPVHLTIPFDRCELVSQLRERARVQSEEYREDGVHLIAYLSQADRGRYRSFTQPP
jgi:GTP-binding protein HflX